MSELKEYTANEIADASKNFLMKPIKVYFKRYWQKWNRRWLELAKKFKDKEAK
jgi:hypothetical protein